MSRRTLLKIITQLRALFREAVGDQIISANPMDGIKTPRGRDDVSKTANIKALNFEQEDRLIVVGTALYDAGMSRLWPALFLLVRMGLRRSEAMGLKWTDIDFNKKILYIRQPRIKAMIGTRTVVPKTKNAERTLPMPADVIDVLKRHQLYQRAERTAASGAWSEQDIVFAMPLGNWTHPDNLNRSLSTLVAWSDPQQTKQARWKGVAPCALRWRLPSRAVVVCLAYHLMTCVIPMPRSPSGAVFLWRSSPGTWATPLC